MENNTAATTQETIEARAMTYTVIGEGGNSEVPYTQPFASLAEALDAVRKQQYPLCPLRSKRFDAATGTFAVQAPIPYCIIEETPGRMIDRFCRVGHSLVRSFNLQTGNVSVPGTKTDSISGTYSYEKLPWPGGYRGCPLTEDLITNPAGGVVDVPSEWVTFCREQILAKAL